MPIAPYLVLIPLYALLIWLDSPALVITFAVLSRFAYVGYVGWALRAEDANGHFTRPHGVEEGFARFRRTASVVMNNDALTLVLVCVMTRGTLGLGLAPVVTAVVGGGLILSGVLTKLWAARTLGLKGYYWYDFFIHPEEAEYKAEGAYRFLSNPMYTVGYLPCYGLAVLLDSWPGLLVSFFAQVAILLFYLVVERPHYERIYGNGRTAISA
jgi:protein-S-isoprenylcysteine O-methyltransferase Ste14